MDHEHAAGEEMLYNVARVELVKTTNCLVRRRADIVKWKEEQDAIDLALTDQTRQADVSQSQRPLRSIPSVEASMSEFAFNREPLARKMVLVLDGPSVLGKTEYVRCLFHTLRC